MAFTPTGHVLVVVELSQALFHSLLDGAAAVFETTLQELFSLNAHNHPPPVPL